MSIYHVNVTRADGTWFADVDGLEPGLIGATDVVAFADLDVEVRDLVAGLVDTDPDELELRWSIRFGGVDVTDLVSGLRRIEAELDALEARRDDLRTALIEAGRSATLPQSAVADVLGLSQQRVAQLARVS